MTFDIDKQTIKDLDLFPDKKNDKSVYSVYKQTETFGGEELLYVMYSTPFSDIENLLNRKNEINFFVDNNCSIKLSSGQLDSIEYYLRNRRTPLKDNIIDSALDKVKNIFKPDSDYITISEGICNIIKLLNKLELFIAEARSFPIPKTLNEALESVDRFIVTKSLKKIRSQTKELNFSQINKLDHFFRVCSKYPLRELLNAVYKIDVLQTLSKMILNDGFTLPDYVSESKPVFEVIDAFHPLLVSPIPNNFLFNENSNLCFITGPNMSGKSTFLKTVGLLIYLGHLGFPVPAKKLRISIYDGLFTTINLKDNLNLGYSHFYSEVRRVKDVVLKINTKRNLVVIFDELFRGTNVKDAFDASLMIITALSRIHNVLFFISTHILEVAEKLDNKNSIMFNCFESKLSDQNLIYDFKIKEGISHERIGLLIIKNEKILDILNEILKSQKST